MIPLRATARLQLHAGFTFDDAAAQVPYYARLGVSHLYLSPIGTAVAGSTHGYDNVDPATINPELGGEPAFLRLATAARGHRLGMVLDIVPNHMATHPTNAWWWDVLRHGRRSRYAGWFDIDWRAPGRDGKLWLPMLDRPYAQALHEGLLQVVECEGELHLVHHDQHVPLSLPTDELPADIAGRSAWRHALNASVRCGGVELHRLIERQPYRLAWWRVGNDMLNYRRFFDITTLVSLRVELPAVFAAVHALPLRLVAEGHVDGLRVDHIDGLADPRRYLRRLRAALDAAGRRRGLAAGRLLLYVEKILAPGECLPHDWQCDGSTGYDFMDQVGGLLHAGGGRAVLTAAWRRHSGRSGDFDQEQRQARDEVLRGPLQAEFTRAVATLSALARRDLDTGEHSPQMLARGLCALLREFSVYRTYARPTGLTLDDAARLDAAVAAACADASAAVQAAVRAIARWLRDDEGASRAQIALRRIVRRRFEQLSAPLNAKAVEDTAFYRHGVLLSRNEVGSHPDAAHFALDSDAFHAACFARAEQYPRALLATATHDHKRGEDVRARLAVLSTRARWWVQQVQRLETLAEDCGIEALAGGDRWMLWQTLVAAWPLRLRPTDRDGLQAYADRVVQWQLKAMREAKLFTCWTDPQPAYEQTARECIERLLTRRHATAVRRALWEAAEAIGPAGARNGLVQTALRLTVAGVPDLYQGCESWDLSLVDPDNRRAVDYPRRHAWLHDSRGWDALVHDWRDGAVKARLVARLLQLRAELPELFVSGIYRPLPVPRALTTPLLTFQRGRSLWVAVSWAGRDPADTALLPRIKRPTVWALPSGRYLDVLSGITMQSERDRVGISTVFAHAPVAVLRSI